MSNDVLLALLLVLGLPWVTMIVFLLTVSNVSKNKIIKVFRKTVKCLSK